MKQFRLENVKIPRRGYWEFYIHLESREIISQRQLILAALHAERKHDILLTDYINEKKRLIEKAKRELEDAYIGLHQKGVR